MYFAGVMGIDTPDQFVKPYNFMIYCVGPYSCYLLNMCSAYSIHIFAFMCLWCTENIILWHCQFGLRVIYHVLHFKLQTPAAKYLFSLSLWGMHMPNTVFAK